MTAIASGTEPWKLIDWDHEEQLIAIVGDDYTNASEPVAIIPADSDFRNALLNAPGTLTALMKCRDVLEDLVPIDDLNRADNSAATALRAAEAAIEAATWPTAPVAAIGDEGVDRSIAELSPEKLADVAREWSSREYADETIRIESIKGFLYAFGSELAVRRLAHKFRSLNVRYSTNMQSWYFCSERV